MTYPPLTTEQLSAVNHYAKDHGLSWKMRLRYDWTAARLCGPLQALGNSHGPSWLISFNLKKALAPKVEVVK